MYKCPCFIIAEIQGAAPINWAIINERQNRYYNNAYRCGMDTGDILLKQEIDISNDITAVNFMIN